MFTDYYQVLARESRNKRSGCGLANKFFRATCGESDRSTSYLTSFTNIMYLVRIHGFLILSLPSKFGSTVQFSDMLGVYLSP
jgi:hypothetical protein